MPFRRRRPLRRPRRRPPRPGGRPPVPPMVQQALRRALRLREAGDFVAAARIYQRLAEEAYARDRVRPAVQMDVEAARALLRARDYDQAEEHALRALRSLLARDLSPRPVMPLVDRFCAALEAQGEDERARRFRETVDALLQEKGLAAADLRPSTAPAAQSKRRLPAQCPSCYAPLRPDEVDWLEADRAQCTYCGNVVLTE